MYIILSIIGLFVGAVIINRFLNKEYDVLMTPELILIRKSPNRTIQFNIILLLIVNLVFSLCLGRDYELNWSFLILIPVFGVVGFMGFMTVKDYRERKNSKIDFKTQNLVQDKEVYDLELVANLEYIAYTRGSSSGHSHTLNVKLSDGSSLELIRAKRKKKVLELNDSLRNKLNIQTEKTVTKGLFENETTIMN